MKRIVSLLMVILLLFCFTSCNTNDDFAVVTQAVENTNAVQTYQEKYLIEMKFADTTLLFAQGTSSIDRNRQRATSDGVKSYLGESGKLTESFYNGFVFTDFENEKSKYPISAEQFLNTLQYSQAINFKYEDIKGLKKSSNSTGTLYSFTVEKGYDANLLALMGEDIYQLAQIVSPQKDKTRFSEIQCEYTLNESGEPMLAGRQMVFTMYLYDTPAYSPNYTPPEEDYLLELEVRINITYQALGGEISIEPPTGDYSTIE